jgi:membrane-bound lytic murein transglycosylase D
MTKRKLYKTGTVTLALILILFRMKAGSPDHKISGNSIPVFLSEKSHSSFFSDSAYVKNTLKSNDNFTAVPLHPSVVDFTDDYIDKSSEMFDKLSKNNSRTLKLIEKIFHQCQLPAELKYIAIVESKLKYNAVSRSGAVGMWQFMPATAQRFGLKITATADDRKNVWKSTVAAAKYLNVLYDCFGDWLLVIAAYNSGPAPVLKAIKKSGSRNFWQIQYLLPKESRMHVKKFIATHFYFEGKGSLVTMGKTETEEYLKSITTGDADEDNAGEAENNSAELPVPTGFIAILTDEKYLKLILKK